MRAAEAGRTALETLDRAIEDRPDRVYEDLVKAVRCLAVFRDALIEEWRAGDAGAEAKVRRLNPIISVAVGAEYPLVGVRWERMKKARGALAELLQAA